LRFVGYLLANRRFASCQVYSKVPARVYGMRLGGGGGGGVVLMVLFPAHKFFVMIPVYR